MPGHDDLVDRQDRPGCLGGKFDGPLLGDQQVQDALLPGVENPGVLLVLVAVLVLCIYFNKAKGWAG